MEDVFGTADRDALKVTKNDDLLPSIVKMTESVNHTDEGPPAKIECFFSILVWTMRFQPQFRYTAV